MSGLGQRAEAIAAQYLEARGLEIVARNWRCRFGEIDLVARHGGMLVFVEVRARSSDVFGGAAASIDRRKQRKLAAAARQYLTHVAADTPCRFDAVLVDAKHCIDWIRDAFQDDG